MRAWSSGNHAQELTRERNLVPVPRSTTSGSRPRRSWELAAAAPGPRYRNALVATMAVLFERLKVVVEPSGAAARAPDPIAAIRRAPCPTSGLSLSRSN